MVISIPVLWWFTRYVRAVAMEGILHIDIDRFAETLQLPVARNGYHIPFAHVVVLTIEVSRTVLWVFRPMKQPLAIKRQYLTTFLPFRGQL